MWKFLDFFFIWLDWGNTAWADMAGLGSLGLNNICYTYTYTYKGLFRKQIHNVVRIDIGNYGLTWYRYSVLETIVSHLWGPYIIGPIDRPTFVDRGGSTF